MGESVIQRSLGPYLNRRIIVVTSDTAAYLGILSEFDTEHLVLTDVYESSTATALTWHKVVLESPVLEGRGGDEVGDEGKKIVLSRVIISMNRVIRFWPIEDGID